MPRFSANLGFLWTELSLPEAIHAAKKAGFEAVECHFPYDVASASSVATALEETGLEMLGINTRLGINGPDDFGVMAMPGRESEARGYVEEAIAYAAEIKCRNINCVPGKTGGAEEAEVVFRENLAFACKKATENGIGIVIEPVNQRDAPGYHFSLVEKGLETIRAVGAENLKLMFDCYHTQIMQGDLTKRLEMALPYIGHVQFAAVPDRGEPDSGEVNYPYLLTALDDMGWQGFVGAEYRPRGKTDEGLGWMSEYR
ncbi:MAG: TIM barrel protein [Gammaproteobacteria bacterium]|nr:TIM barrel protein [Gammaproteobacteria bacterium]